MTILPCQLDLIVFICVNSLTRKFILACYFDFEQGKLMLVLWYGCFSVAT